MITLINDLLNVARIEEGRYIYKPTPVDFEELIQKVIGLYEEEIKKKNLKLDFKKPKAKLPSLPVDEEKMEQVIQNLIGNAVKYTPAEGKVTIFLKGGIKEIEVSVADTGIGIPKNQQEKVFSKFFRAANATRQGTEGTGLGLFIAKNIIKAHSGKIWFESQEGKGTTFSLTLPVTKIK